MKAEQVELCCPRCKGDLDARQDAFRCAACNEVYPVILGVPDFRIFPDPYIGIEADRAKARIVAEHFDRLDFAELIDFYYDITDVVPAAQARLFKRGLLAAGPRAANALAAWEARARPARSHRSLLELGCGTAPLLVAASQQYECVVGIDIAFRWLIVAKKRLAEAGVEASLYCACAEALPFRSGTFDVVVADSVIEVVHDQSASLGEAQRVMRPGGNLYIATPNRFSVGPDPHLGIPAGGFLPKGIAARIARMRGAIPPKRNLLSKSALVRLLASTGFSRSDVFLPDVPEAQRRFFPPLLRVLIGLYQFAKRMPVTKQLLYLIGPLFYAVATKQERSGGRPVANDEPAMLRAGRV